MSKSSLRRMIFPPWDLAASQANREQNRLPRCRYPLGVGANRPTTRAMKSPPFTGFDYRPGREGCQ